MLLLTMLLSSGIITVSVISGVVVLYQLRQTTNIADSTRAAYAADAGLECELYRQFKAPAGFSCTSNPSFTCGTDAYGAFCSLPNNSLFRIIAVPAAPFPGIRAVGESGRSARAFEVGFSPAP